MNFEKFTGLKNFLFSKFEKDPGTSFQFPTDYLSTIQT